MQENNLAISMLNVYSTVLMKIDALSILFDPLGIGPEKCNGIDLVIVTHEHIDHFDRRLVVEIHDRTNAIVLTTPFVAQQLTGLPGVVPLYPGDSYQMKEVSIYAENCVHAANDPVTLVIQTDRGVAVFHPCDSDFFPELTAIREKYKPQIMIYTGSSEQNLTAISAAICPDVIVANAYPMLKEFNIPGTMVKTLKQSEWFLYPFKKE
jgi:L-ascorbate metabolism protein UlaG (beta-lactamase superfamily)